MKLSRFDFLNFAPLIISQAHTSDFNAELKLKGFKVYEICSTDSVVRSYNRKDFYKICLNTGKNIIHYADRSFETDGPVLFFGNPHIPYFWETISSTYTGYACLFTEDFLKFGDRSEILQQSPGIEEMFNILFLLIYLSFLSGF